MWSPDAGEFGAPPPHVHVLAQGETLRPVVKNFRDYIMGRVGELPS